MQFKLYTDVHEFYNDTYNVLMYASNNTFNLEMQEKI